MTLLLYLNPHPVKVLIPFTEAMHQINPCIFKKLYYDLNHRSKTRFNLKIIQNNNRIITGNLEGGVYEQ